MYHRILVPFDGSAPSSRGLDEAIGIAALTGARLRLIHMPDVLDFTNGFEPAEVYMEQVVPFMTRAGQDILADGEARAKRAGVAVDTVLVDGMKSRLCDVVAEYARSWDAELIVIGTHGRRGVGRLLLGSDAEQIARTAPVPVLLVRMSQAGADVSMSAPATVASVHNSAKA